MYRCVNTERQGYHYGNEDSGSAQHQRVRETLHKGLEYVTLGHIGLAHVSGQHAFHIVAISYDEWVIQSKFFTDLLDLLWLRVIACKH